MHHEADSDGTEVATFSDSHEHLAAELRRVNLLLTLRVHAHLALSSANARKLVGAHLDEHDIRSLLRWAADPEAAFSAEQTPPQELRHEFDEARAYAAGVHARREASRAEGVALLLDRVCLAARLTPLEQDVLLLTLLAEVDPNVGLLFAYLNDDLTRRFPTVHSLCSTLATSYDESSRMHRLFVPDASLPFTGIIWTRDDELPLALRGVRLSSVAAHVLLEHPGMPVGLRPVADVSPPAALEALCIEEKDLLRLRALCDRYIRGFHQAQKNGRPGASVLLGLIGLDTADQQSVASGIAHQLGVPLLVARVPCILAEAEPIRMVRELVLLMRLNGCVLFVEGVERLVDASSGFLYEWDRILSGSVGFVVFDGDPARASGEWQSTFVRMQLTPRDAASRLQLWKNATDGMKVCEDVDLTALSGAFRLNARQIALSVAWARGSTLLRTENDGCLSQTDLQAACRRHSDSALSEHGTRIEPRRGWEDLILPEEQAMQLQEISLRLKHHYTVYESWKLGLKVSSGKGVSALFAGPSGTGKTMAAEILARSLGQEAYRIDLSALVSKYIGETEKNLSKVFDAAERSNAVLFFDEADALFGKRSDVKDAHDRYANIQVAYLLQRIEAYRGVAILATNLKANTDEAFIRRLDFLVEFPFPETETRARIWQSLLATPVPVGNIDIDMLSEKFRITGGVIKNAVVHAAFLAAEEGGPVEMSHLFRALRREYQKMGRLTSEIEAFSSVANRVATPKKQTRKVSGGEPLKKGK